LENKAASVGSFAANLRSFEAVRDFLTSATLLAIVDLPFGIIFVLVVAWISPLLVIPITVGIVLLLIYAWWAQSRMHELTEKTYRATALRNASLIESLTGLETVKALAAEQVMQQKWESTSIYLAGINAKVKQFSATVTSGAQLVQHLIGVSIIVMGVYLIGEQELTMGGLIAVYMLSTRAIAPMGQMAGLLTQYQSVRTAYKGLEDIMANSVERPEGKQFVVPSAIAGKIEFRDVAFAYPNQEQQALRGVSFNIQPGEHVAILGRNGSGKSTILRLMLGLYQPTAGSVFIDNADLRQLDPAQVRRSAGYVQQDITLFYGSLRDNIRMGRRFDDEQILHALQLGRLKPFVDHHPKGLDMMVGERGESLSGGQRQGVAIARALVGDPSMVLMDEPTGAMDNSSEEEIKQSLKQFLNNRTFVLITHRTSLLSLVDRIIVLDSGKVVADGPKEQVIEALRQGRIGKAV
jgi:ATP-binding cassette subfamily C protein LapB